MLAGEVGQYVVVARQAKGSGEWWIGATGSASARDVTVPLAFLPKGRFTAEIWRDGPTAEAGAKGHDMVRETKAVTAADNLAIRIAPGGGFAIRIGAPKKR